MARKLKIFGNFPSGEIDPAEVKQIVDDYLEENPPATDTPSESILYTEQTLTDEQKKQARENIGVVNITINGASPDENGNFVINAVPGETNNVVEF